MVLQSLSQRSQQQARAAYRALQDEFDVQVSRLAFRLAEDRVSLQAWGDSMRALIRQHHVNAAALVGDLNDPVLRGLVQQQISRQLDYFQRWFSQLSVTVRTKDMAKAIAARARLYGAAGGETFHIALALTVMGVQLPFYPKTRTACKANCRCQWRILQRGVGDFDCFWDLGANEHCPTCRARGKTANPLKIRNGQIVKPEKYLKSTLYA